MSNVHEVCGTHFGFAQHLNHVVGGLIMVSVPDMQVIVVEGPARILAITTTVACVGQNRALLDIPVTFCIPRC